MRVCLPVCLPVRLRVPLLTRAWSSQCAGYSCPPGLCRAVPVCVRPSARLEGKSTWHLLIARLASFCCALISRLTWLADLRRPDRGRCELKTYKTDVEAIRNPPKAKMPKLQDQVSYNSGFHNLTLKLLFAWQAGINGLHSAHFRSLPTAAQRAL